MTTLGERLRTTRKMRNLTLKQLAIKSGISQTTITSYEKDIVDPTVFRLMCICDVLDVSIDWIVRGE